MFSVNLRNNIEKIYLRILNNSNDVFVDINRLTEYLDSVKRINGLKLDFDYNTLKYQYLNELVEYLDLNNFDYVIHCDDYQDFRYLEDLTYILYNLTLYVPGDLGNVIYRSDNIDYMNLYFKLQNLSLHNNLNFSTDIFIDKKNIYKVHETLTVLSKLKINSYLYLKDYTRSANYDNKCLGRIIDCIEPNIGYRLAIDNIMEDNNLLINNIDELNFTYNRLETKQFMCKINSDLTFISIDENFKIRLCNNIIGKKCSNLDPFECLDDNGHPTEKYIECIQEDYKELCCGCNCHQKYSERNLK